jgi:hypothetical protein
MVKDRVVALADNTMVEVEDRVVNKAAAAKAPVRVDIKQSTVVHLVVVAVALVPATVAVGEAAALFVLFGVQDVHSQLLMQGH